MNPEDYITKEFATQMGQLMCVFITASLFVNIIVRELGILEFIKKNRFTRAIGFFLILLQIPVVLLAALYDLNAGIVIGIGAMSAYFYYSLGSGHTFLFSNTQQGYFLGATLIYVRYALETSGNGPSNLAFMDEIGFLVVIYMLFSFSINFLLRHYKIIEKVRHNPLGHTLNIWALRLYLMLAVSMLIVDPIIGYLLVLSAIAGLFYFYLGSNQAYLFAIVQQGMVFALFYGSFLLFVANYEAQQRANERGGLCGWIAVPYFCE